METATTLPEQTTGLEASLYAGSGAAMPNDIMGTHLFFWLTLTMFWVLMILCILALFKYVTHDTPHTSAPSRRRSAK